MKKNLIIVGMSLLSFIAVFTSCKKNHAPEIIDVSFSPSSGKGGTIFTFTVQAVDQDRDPLTYLWTCDNGNFLEGSTSSQAKWQAPVLMEDQLYLVKVSVSDGAESITETTQIQVGKTETGSISGNVYFAGCAIPVSGVSVEIAEKTATTGSEGNFSINAVPIGIQNISVRKTDYDDFSQEVLIEKDKNTEVIVSLTSQRFTSKVYGTVKDQDGRAISGAIVVVLNPDNSESELRTTSSATGYYQLPTVPQGERTIVVNKSNYQMFQSSIFIVDRDYEFDIRIMESTDDCVDPDGRSYKTIQIGTQTWMAENLAYLPSVSPPSSGSDTSPHYYVWGYEESSVSGAKATANYTTYGVLYNWEAAKTACPEGWHLPSDEEWKTLEMHLGMSNSDADNTGWRHSGDVGMKLKSASGWEDDGNGTNSSGFNALPGGGRYYYGGFGPLGSYASFWSSSEYGSSLAWSRSLHYYRDGVYRNNFYRGYGFSVRCLKN